MEYILLALCT